MQYKLIDFLATSDIMQTMVKNSNNIPLSINDLKVIRSLGFSCAEMVVVGVCLTFTDNCWCSTIPSTEIMKILGVSERAFYYTMKKLKVFGVVKCNHRYDYSKFVKSIEEEVKRLDSLPES